MPRIVGTTKRVVEVDGVFAINEIVGNVATGQDNLSVARVVVEKATAEPWLTLHYDEWMCVLKGRVELHHTQQQETGDTENTRVLNVQAGETAFIGRGERFRPVFPVENSEYIAICLPAFAPDRCIREDEDEGDHKNVASNLKTLHTNSDDEDIVYHMCEQSRWNEALSSGRAYFPQTFEKDGGFTHATLKPSQLLGIANHYYLDSKDGWICIAVSQSALKAVGIVTKFEEAKPVGDTKIKEDMAERMPHIFGGIPANLPGIVRKVYPIERNEDGKFLSIKGI